MHCACRKSLATLNAEAVELYKKGDLGEQFWGVRLFACSEIASTF